MSGLLDLLNSGVGKQIISGVSNQTGHDENKTADILGMAMPLLMGAMKKNASTPEGASGLMSALTGSKHDGSILNNLEGLFEGGVDDQVMQDGSGILGHILGSKQSSVENALSAKSGVDAGSVGQILKVAAPILMGYLGKQSRETNVSDANGLTSMLGGMLGGQSSQNQSLITSLLDSDGDGSILDDVVGMATGAGKRKAEAY